MGIELLSGLGNMQSYYNISKVPVVSPEEVKKQQEAVQSQSVPSQVMADNNSLTLNSKEDTRPKTTDLHNFSLTFNKEDTYDYIGSESSLADLDMQKAISDMRKDEVLQEYQYFVGSAQNLISSPEDGMVFQKYYNNK